MVSEDVQTITDSNLQMEVLQDRGLVLVDFRQPEDFVPLAHCSSGRSRLTR